MRVRVLERHALAVDITERFDAFDISPEAVEVARREAEGVGYGDRIAYEAQDLNVIELEKDRYDAVFATQTLHHIEALEQLLDEIRDSLTLAASSWSTSTSARSAFSFRRSGYRS